LRPAATLLPVKRATRCPDCGEPVSVFAVGCAICGADLQQHRREIEERRTELDAHFAPVALVLLAPILLAVGLYSLLH
jgi:hypothetical protein